MTLYKQCGSPLTTLGAGDYLTRDLDKDGVPANSINAIAIAGDDRCMVQSYSNDFFEGDDRVWGRRSETFKDGKCHTIDDFSNRTKSLIVNLGM